MNGNAACGEIEIEGDEVTEAHQVLSRACTIHRLVFRHFMENDTETSDGVVDVRGSQMRIEAIRGLILSTGIAIQSMSARRADAMNPTQAVEHLSAAKDLFESVLYLELLVADLPRSAPE